MNMMLSAMFLMSIILLFLNHPLSLGLILIIQTLISSMIIGYMMESFLFSYIIMIIMLSGALVLFIYMASVASNEKFKSPMYVIIWSVGMFTISQIILMVYNKPDTLFMNNFNKTETISLIKIFNTLTSSMTIMMIIYLLFTMIVVSNIAKVNEGPLRIKKYE